jgi:hypothetical protein
VTGPELWRAFGNDPRAPANARMRASDADRDLVLGALAEAYAEGRLDREEYDERSDAVHGAKTLGELPGQLDDLVPPAPILVLGSAALATVDQQAVARWEKSRRDAFMGFFIPTLVCWMIWAVTMFGEFPWPLFVTVGSLIPFVSINVQKKDMIESNRSRIIRRQERDQQKALRKQQRRPPELGS